MPSIKNDPNCSRCNLCKDTDRVCILSPYLKTKIMIIGEAPGQNEKKTGVLFSGQAGRLLNETLEKVGLNRDDCFVANAVSCHPVNNKTPTKSQIKACRHWVEYQISVIKPKFILILGGTALQSVLDMKGIKSIRGRPVDKDGIIYFPTYHPAFILRDMSQLSVFEQDLETFSHLIKTGGMPKEKKLNLKIVNNLSTFEKMIADIEENSLISYDIETNGLYPFASGAQITLFGIGTRKTQWSMPLQHPQGFVFNNHRLQTLLLKRIVKAAQGGRMCAHNAKFDSLWLLALYGIKWLADDDTMLMHYILDENSKHGLKELATRFCKAPNYDIDKDEKRGNTSLDKICFYHAHDLFYTRSLCLKFRSQLSQDLSLTAVYDKIIMPTARMFVDVEYEGVYIDIPRLKEVEIQLNKVVQETTKKMSKYGKDINWGSPKQVAKLLFEDLGIQPLDITPTGAPSTSESVLKRLAVHHEVPNELMKFREAKQQLSFFIEGWQPNIVNRRLHPSFKIHGTVTGRLSCIRRGSLIKVPGKDVPIEEIKPGDLVYTYNDNLELTLKKVINTWYRGKKPIKRIYWVSTNSNRGYLDATADHRIRLIDGSYIKVEELRGGFLDNYKTKTRGYDSYKKGERVLALHRNSSDFRGGKRNYLRAYNLKTTREYRFIFETIYGWKPEQVHHKDENTLNDNPDNLVGTTSGEHRILHSKILPKNLVIKALKKSKGIKKDAAKLLGCSKEVLNKNIKRYNHMITHIENLPGLYDVYDLEVEDTHNFIANELCVHNCEGPNLQQVPRDTLIRSLIIAPEGWECIEADLSQVELRIAAELANERSMLHAFMTGEDIHWKTVMRELGRKQGHYDLVMLTGKTLCQKKVSYGEALEAMIQVGPDECIKIDGRWKEIRKKAKAINFGFLYGMWWPRFVTYARDNYGVLVTDDEAMDARENFFELYPDFLDWHDKQKRFARMHGYVRTLTGRKRRLPEAAYGKDTPQSREALRQAINTPVQSYANDHNLMAAIEMHKEFDPLWYRIIGTVHDSILMYVRKDKLKFVIKRVKEIMRRPKLMDELGVSLSVPIEADVKIGPWGLGKSEKDYFKSA